VRNYLELVGLTDAELARLDPIEMNLLVAKSIPSLAGLDIGHYQKLADEWAKGVAARLPYAEKRFQQSPAYWKNDVNFVRLSVLFEHLDRGLGITYNEYQRDANQVLYTNPSQLFVNGVMDTRQGSCSSLAALYLALAWRLGWPVSLATAVSHLFCRYDDGRVRYNIETSRIGTGGFAAPEDDEVKRRDNLTPKAILSGSDLRAVTPRERLGLFVGMRARHLRDTGNLTEAEPAYLLARHLFPRNRCLYFGATWVALQQSWQLFEADEPGNPRNLADAIAEHYGRTAPPQPARRVDVGYTIKV
jgi:hypothetical protein